MIERIDFNFLKKLKKEDDKLGSIKRIEKILTALGYDGRSITATLAGVYDLRLADAHLPSNDKITDSMKLVRVDFEQLKLNSGKRLIENINESLIQIRDAFAQGDLTKLK